MAGDVGLGAPARAVAGALNGLRVNRENVLRVHNALKAEAIRLDRVLRMHGAQLHVAPCGSDPVSQPAAEAFNAKLAAFGQQCFDYVDALHKAADELARTARDYGYTEEQIAASFAGYEHPRPLGPGEPR